MGSAAVSDVRVELKDGRGVRLYFHSFRWNRWRGDTGYGTEGDGRQKKRRVRMYQWPLGLVHVLGKWEPRQKGDPRL